MKTAYLKNTLVATAFIGAGALFAGNASAQSELVPQQSPVTRAQVNAELAELQVAGYRPVQDETQYPRNLQAAVVRVQALRAQAAQGIPTQVSQHFSQQ
jgi:hypothetical protein